MSGSKRSPSPEMAEGAPSSDDQVVCPHCKKSFSAHLIAGSAERYRGFKCPHCRLFVPETRTKP
jgi:DNA-directed RNA polymerase subunit RPC12/RpoP